jgi:four helix bundle protein
MNDNNKFGGIENLDVYKGAVEISDEAWIIFNTLSKNFQYHIGNQFLDAADSIGANISEGYGRYHYRESINFNNFARGSAFETRYWLSRLYKRSFINESTSNVLNNLLESCIAKINGYNSYLGNKLKDQH